MLIQEGIKYTQKLYGVEIKKIASDKAVYFAFSLNPDSTMEQRKELSNLVQNFKENGYHKTIKRTSTGKLRITYSKEIVSTLSA